MRLSHDFRTTVARLSHDCRATVARLSRDCRTTVARRTVARLSHDCRTTVARLPHDCRTTVARYCILLCILTERLGKVISGMISGKSCNNLVIGSHPSRDVCEVFGRCFRTNSMLQNVHCIRGKLFCDWLQKYYFRRK